jgi:hypothetical protein
MLTDVPVHVTVLAQLAAAPFEFRLTGSRFFGFDKPDSDWDFFAGPLQQGGLSRLSNWLVQNGFFRESNVDYTGVLGVTQLWRHRLAAVHVQTVQDPELKSEVQRFMKNEPRYARQLPDASKQASKDIWASAYSEVLAQMSL